MTLKYGGEEIYGLAEVTVAIELDDDGDYVMEYGRADVENIPDFIYGSSADVGTYETLKEIKEAINKNNAFMRRRVSSVVTEVENK